MASTPFVAAAIACVLFAQQSAAFLSPQQQQQHHRPTCLLHSTNQKKNIVVVSPPGGVGEVAVVEAAERGSSVRWFVVNNEEDSKPVVLARRALDRIATAGGSVELAGADMASILMGGDGNNNNNKDAEEAIASWCRSSSDGGSVDVLISTLDGVETSLNKNKKRKAEQEDPQEMWTSAVKLATKTVAEAGSPKKRIAILSASEEVDEEDEKENDSGIGNLVGGLLFGKSVSIPSSLVQAMGKGVLKLRHGNLFGTPESSPDFSALTDGPKREAELCEEYQMRVIRVDPTLSVSGNIMMGGRSSRHAVGAAAALMALDCVECSPDVCVSSQPGRDLVTIEEWQDEFSRVKEAMESGEAAKLFSFDFSSVPDTERLADWLNSKWAPTVLRTYDIAAIRTGARPVFSNRGSNPGEVEIVWQQLLDFETTITVGRMVIRVSDTGVSAVRAPGDASQGYGSVSTKPLPGEAVLVRRLAEGAAQAIEKGLAKKPRAIEKKEPKPRPVKVTPPVVLESPKPEPTIDSGPRKAGARRSVERKRRKTPKESS